MSSLLTRPFSALMTAALRFAFSPTAVAALGAVVSTATVTMTRSGEAVTSPWPVTEIVRWVSVALSSARARGAPTTIAERMVTTSDLYAAERRISTSFTLKMHHAYDGPRRTATAIIWCQNLSAEFVAYQRLLQG